MKIKVSTLTQVFETASKDYEVCDNEVEGEVRIPETASFTWQDIVWLEENHIVDQRCKRCSSHQPCLQHVTIDEEGITVVHDYQGQEGEAMS